MSSMDVSEYRAQFEAEMAEAAKGETSAADLLRASRPKPSRRAKGLAAAAPEADPVDDALAVLRDADAGDRLRSAALQVVALDVADRPEVIDALLDLVRDSTVPSDLRAAVLDVVQQISFRLVLFPDKRPAYLEALRSIVDDPDAELRRRAIGILAREKDEYVQRRLVDGLEGRSRALVPAAKAIQFLGYDVHAEHLPMLRRMVEDPPNNSARKEAIRLLAIDPGSADLLLGIVEDKGERADVRRVAVVALQSVAPEKLESEARRIVVDDREDDQLQAVALNALTYFGDPAALAGDAELSEHVRHLRQASPSRHLKQATAAYMTRHLS